MRPLITSIVLFSALTVPVLVAPTAAAATITVTDASCAANSSGSPITGAPGDVIDISATLTGCRSVLVSKAIVNSQSDVTVTLSAGTLTVLDQTTHWNFDSNVGGQLASVQITLGSSLGAVTNAIEVVAGSGGPPPKTQWNVTIGSGGGSSAASVSSSAPAPIFQQFGKPASGTCDAAAPASLNWSGVASGGWGESWAQWMNEGKGGAVCTRTLVYSSNLGTWTLG